VTDLRETLGCFGKYGYGSGWIDSDYCISSCGARQLCFRKFLDETGKEVKSGEERVHVDTVINQHKHFGKVDRHDGHSRFAIDCRGETFQDGRWRGESGISKALKRR